MFNRRSFLQTVTALGVFGSLKNLFGFGEEPHKVEDVDHYWLITSTFSEGEMKVLPTCIPIVESLSNRGLVYRHSIGSHSLKDIEEVRSLIGSPWPYGELGSEGVSKLNVREWKSRKLVYSGGLPKTDDSSEYPLGDFTTMKYENWIGSREL